MLLSLTLSGCHAKANFRYVCLSSSRSELTETPKMAAASSSRILRREEVQMSPLVDGNFAGRWGKGCSVELVEEGSVVL